MDAIIRLLGFGSDKVFYESKGFWALLIGIIWAAAVYFTGIEPGDPETQKQALEAATEVVKWFGLLAGVLRTVSAFRRRPKATRFRPQA